MADDETIRIQVDSVEARAQLAALEKEVRELEAELKTLNSTAGVTNAEIEGTTRRLGEARAKFAEAGASVQSFGQSASKAGFNLKDLSKNVGAGISVIAILQENLRALEPALDKVGEALKFAAEQAGASHDSVEQAALGFDMLIHPSHIVENNIKLLANAWKGLMEEMVPSSTVITNNVKSIEESLKILEAARKKAADANADAKGDEEKAARSLAAEEAALEAAAVKSAEERAKAEAKAADEVVAALAKQEESFLKMLEDTNKFVAERDKILKAPNAGFDSSQDASKAKEDLSGLNKQIKAIRDSPIITEDQHQQLKDLELQARAASDEVKNLGDSYTIANMNGEDLANKQNAAWEKYYAIRHANDQIVQRNTEKDLRAIGEQTDAVGELGDSAEDAAGSLGDAAEAAGSLGDNAKEGTDKAKEGMDGISEAVGSLTGKLTEAEVVIDRIAVKLAALQLGS